MGLIGKVILGNNFKNDHFQFIKELFTIIPVGRIRFMRFDAGFYIQELMDLLEEQQSEVKYNIRAKMTSCLAADIEQQNDWVASEDVMKGAEYCVANYTIQNSKKSGKIVIVRTPKSEAFKSGILFESMAAMEKIEYKVYETNALQ